MTFPVRASADGDGDGASFSKRNFAITMLSRLFEGRGSNSSSEQSEVQQGGQCEKGGEVPLGGTYADVK